MRARRKPVMYSINRLSNRQRSNSAQTVEELGTTHSWLGIETKEMINLTPFLTQLNPNNDIPQHNPAISHYSSKLSTLSNINPKTRLTRAFSKGFNTHASQVAAKYSLPGSNAS